MAGFIISRFTRNTAVALAVAASLVGVAHADLESARQALGSNDYSGAVAALDQVLQKTPGDPEALFLKGLALARSGDTEGALGVFNGLVKDQPAMAEAWNNLGVLRARDGDLPGARDALQQAVGIDPQHGPAQENLGDIYVALARNAYSRAGELESDNAIARTKSQQLAAFISSGQSNDQNADRGTSGLGNTAATQAVAASEASGPPPAPTVTDGAQGGAAFDTSTPRAALESWARAWTEQNVARYLAMYGDAFVPDEKQSRETWAAIRRERVSSPAFIEVRLSDVQVRRRGEQAVVVFDQRYRSNSYQDREHKALLMGHTADGWQILREGDADSIDFTTPEQSPERAAAQAISADSRNSQPLPAASESTTSDATGSASQNSQPSAAAKGSASTRAGAGTTPGQQSAPAQMLAASKTQAERQAVREVLQGWAQAWSAQDLQAYLNAYSDNYHPSAGESRTDWVRDRRSAVTAPAWIKVELSDVQVSLLDAERAQASFNQRYQSAGYEDRERKRVTLVHEDGGWRIVRES